MEIKQRAEWKDVPIDSRYFNEKAFSGFGSIKVLTHYDLVHPNPKEKRSKQTKITVPQGKSGVVKESKSRQAQASKEEKSYNDETKLVSKVKKKKRQKQKSSLRNIDPNDDSVAQTGASPMKKERKKRRKKGRANLKTDSECIGADPTDKKDNKKTKEIKPKDDSQVVPQNTNMKKAAKRGSAGTSSKLGTRDKQEASPPKKKKTDLDMSGWKELFVPQVVLKALEDAGFSTPTPIQCLALPPAIRDRKDILGAAETGSGKTLAFGIPMIHNILQYQESHPEGVDDSDSDGELEADDELEEASDPLDEDSSDDGNATYPEGEDAEDIFEERTIELADVDEEDEGINEDEQEVEDQDISDEQDLDPSEGEEFYELADGEMGCVAAINNVRFDWLDEVKDAAEAKRMAADAKKPLHGLVLTPTRELAIQVRNHLQIACSHTNIQVCAIVGGMAAQKQERLLRKCPEIVVATPGRFWELLEEGNPHLAKVGKVKTLVIDEADRMVEKGHFAELKQFFEYMSRDSTPRRQTFVYSATLTLLHETPNRLKHKKKVQKMTTDQKLGDLVELIGLEKKAKVIDLTSKVGTAETLVESKINCTKEEKDIYLHYFLQQYPGRTLVFTNSKDCLRRVVSILNILETNPLPLHADMHQRQRLKNLDRFRDDPKGLLIATDVAARGLDIPNVQHVIHYQVPRTSENYVHRSGRTARATKEGLSVMLVGPDDLNNYRRIVKTLNRDEDLGSFPVEPEKMAAAKVRVSLACKIDKAEHSQTKLKKQNLWFQRAAQEMDIELDEDELLNDLGDSHEQAIARQRVSAMRRDLKYLLSQPIIPKRFSSKYPTKAGKLSRFDEDNESGACAAARKEASKTGKFKVQKIKIKRLKKQQKGKGKKGNK